MAPRPRMPRQVKEADADGENVRGREGVAPHFRHAAPPRHRAWGQADLAQAPSVERLREHHLRAAADSAGASPGWSPHGQALHTRRHIALGGPESALADGAAVSEQLRAGPWPQQRGHAEIHKPHGSILQEDVLQRDISVSYVVRVQVLHSLQQLPSIGPDLQLRDARARSRETVELPPFRKLRHEVGAPRVGKGPQQPQYVQGKVPLPGEVCQNANLRQRILVLVLVDELIRHLLDRTCDAAAIIPFPTVQLDSAEQGLAQQANHLQFLRQLFQAHIGVEVPQVGVAGVTLAPQQLQGRRRRQRRPGAVRCELLLAREEPLLRERHTDLVEDLQLEVCNMRLGGDLHHARLAAAGHPHHR
mmetsp:Transcript_59378/g.170618  ORF Transcript_59378/g.170618 Transcript_59378/m.170618 type:complete len:361 (+) Transcript_59378:289-1371(+)